MNIKLSQLSKELVVLREIKELTNNNIISNFTNITKSLNDKGLCSRGTVSKAIDILFDQGQIYAEWGLTTEGLHCRILKIRSEADSFAEKLLEIV